MTTATTAIMADQGRITNIGKISKHVQFVLCSCCFWCASSLHGRVDKICPSCKASTIGSIPLAGTQMLVDNYAAKSIEQAYAFRSISAWLTDTIIYSFCLFIHSSIHSSSEISSKNSFRTDLGPSMHISQTEVKTHQEGYEKYNNPDSKKNPCLR